ncbi:MAG: hypothetical protein ACR2NT_09550 [Acidimicrobiia bacterium]
MGARGTWARQYAFFCRDVDKVWPIAGRAARSDWRLALTCCGEAVSPVDSLVPPATDPPPSSLSSATSIAPEAAPASSWPQGVVGVFASDQGVFLIAEGAYAPDLQLSDRPTGAAYLVGSDLVIAQETSDSTGYPRSLDGHITIFNRLGSRPLAAGDGELRLLEAGVVNGRPVALINSRTGGGLEDMDDRLLLVDLLTEHRTDLGSVGGWESSVGNVRLSSGVIAFLTSSEDDLGLRALLLDGTELWTLPIGSDSHFSVAVGTIEVAVLQPRFIDPDFTPALTLTRFSLANGSNLGTTDLTLHFRQQASLDDQR